MRKTCNTCGLSKDLEDFSKKEKSKDGRQGKCKACASDYGTGYYAKNSEEIKERTAPRRDRQKELLRQAAHDYLGCHPCVDCSESDIVVLEFDHLNNKSYNISDIIRMGMSLDSLYEELAKCVVRCANCHKRKTAKDQKWSKLNHTNIKI
jgi:hypothetical protein